MKILLALLLASMLAACAYELVPERPIVQRFEGLTIVVRNPYNCLEDKANMKCVARSELEHVCSCQ